MPIQGAGQGVLEKCMLKIDLHQTPALIYIQHTFFSLTLCTIGSLVNLRWLSTLLRDNNGSLVLLFNVCLRYSLVYASDCVSSIMCYRGVSESILHRVSVLNVGFGDNAQTFLITTIKCILLRPFNYISLTFLR